MKKQRSTFISSFNLILDVIREGQQAMDLKLVVKFQCVQDDEGHTPGYSEIMPILCNKLNNWQWTTSLNPSTEEILLGIYHLLVTDTRLPWLYSIEVIYAHESSMTLLRENVGNEGEPHHADKTGRARRKKL